MYNMEHLITMDKPTPSLYRCECGEDLGKVKKVYCADCQTPSQRKKRDETNKEIFAKVGLTYALPRFD